MVEEVSMEEKVSVEAKATTEATEATTEAAKATTEATEAGTKGRTLQARQLDVRVWQDRVCSMHRFRCDGHLRGVLCSTLIHTLGMDKGT